jgi:large subunit ribosomal protein L25
MATRPVLVAEPRARSVRKSDVRRLRRAGFVSGSVYGHGEPEIIQIAARTLQDYLRHHTVGALLDLQMVGGTMPALMREVERDPVTGAIIDVGFQRVNLAETVRVSIPLVFTGEDVVIENKLVPQHQMTELEVHARADMLPESITIDLSRAQAGDTIRVGDLQLPPGVEPTKGADVPVVTVTVPSVSADVEAALDAEEAAHATLAAGTAEEGETGGDTEKGAD